MDFQDQMYRVWISNACRVDEIGGQTEIVTIVEGNTKTTSESRYKSLSGVCILSFSRTYTYTYTYTIFISCIWTISKRKEERTSERAWWLVPTWLRKSTYDYQLCTQHWRHCCSNWSQAVISYDYHRCFIYRMIHYVLFSQWTFKFSLTTPLRWQFLIGGRSPWNSWIISQRFQLANDDQSLGRSSFSFFYYQWNSKRHPVLSTVAPCIQVYIRWKLCK